jgi:23S rRNA pseudouridine2605 synthase
VLCTTSDQFGRKTILDLIPEHRKARLFTMGRLDLDAEGLVVVTNDGDFAHDVLHPRRKLPRTYWVKLRGNVGPDEIARAREGVWLSDGRTPPMEVRVLRAGREISTAKCTLVERHHHQLKRIWARLGTPVLRMVLVRIATVGTEDLKKGAVRPLTPPEVAELRSGSPGPEIERSARRRPVEVPPEKEGPVAWGAPADREPDRPRSSRRDSERRGPPRGGSDRRRPPRGASDRRGPPRGESDRRRPPRAESDRRGPPRGERDRRKPSGGGPGGRAQRGPRSSASSSGRAFRNRGRKS